MDGNGIAALLARLWLDFAVALVWSKPLQLSVLLCFSLRFAAILDLPTKSSDEIVLLNRVEELSTGQSRS